MAKKRGKREFEPFTIVLAGAILFFIADVLAQLLAAPQINWLQAFSGAVVFSIFSYAVLEVGPGRRLVLILAIALALLVILFSARVTGIMPF